MTAYRSKHEMICVFKRGEAAHVNNVELGRHGRYLAVMGAAGAVAGVPLKKKPVHLHEPVTDEQRAALAEIVEAGPIPAIHGVVRWRRRDLAQWLWEEFGVSLDETTVGRELRRMGYARGKEINDFKANRQGQGGCPREQ